MHASALMSWTTSTASGPRQHCRLLSVCPCVPAGKYVDLKDTISGFQGIMAGKYDDLPEMAFYMVGDIKEVQVRHGPSQ